MTSRGLPLRMNRSCAVADLSKLANNPPRLTNFLLLQARRKTRAARLIIPCKRLCSRDIPPKKSRPRPRQVAPTLELRHGAPPSQIRLGCIGHFANVFTDAHATKQIMFGLLITGGIKGVGWHETDIAVRDSTVPNAMSSTSCAMRPSSTSSTIHLV